MKKRILSLLLVSAMVLSLFAGMSGTASAGSSSVIYVSASGSDEDNGNETSPLKTIDKALTKAGSNKAKIVLLSDITENVTVGSSADITLDLNDHVLSGDGTTSVITNFGILTVTDGATSKTTRYFTDGNSDGCFETLETGYNPTNKTEGTDHVKTVGGCITGGTGTNFEEQTYGGGICNYDTLTVTGGTIVGNTADYGGGIYNEVDYSTAISDGSIVGNTAAENGGGVYVSITPAQCLIEGTQITMADGSTKNIEDVAMGDCVKSFNHETGEFENNRVYYSFCGETTAPYFTLHFASGVDLGICGCHDLFERSANRYVTVSKGNCERFVGEAFYNAASGTWDQLLGVTKSSDKVHYYSLYVGKTFNCIANGMLTVPDDVDFYLNMYSFRSDLSVDVSALQADIETYGLFTLEECQLVHTSEMFEMFNLKYYNILVGKGLWSDEAAADAFAELYGDAETEEQALNTPAAETAQTKAACTLTTSSAQYEQEMLTASALTLGGKTIITGNTVGGAANNVYLCDGKTITIGTKTSVSDGNGIAVPDSAMFVGVTLPNGTGAITTRDSADYTVYFTSDKYNYEVKFVAGNTEDYDFSNPLYFDHLELVEKDFTVRNIAELEELAKAVNDGIFDFTDCTVTLANDFKNVDKDGSAAALTTPIGTSDHPFKGTFDGNGKKLKLDITGKQYAGLFGCVNGGTVKNAGTYGTVKGFLAGGIVGYQENGSIINCYSTCNVVCTAESGAMSAGAAGGIVGNNAGTVKNCYATGTATATGDTPVNAHVGGVTGENFGTIEGCCYLENRAYKGIGSAADDQTKTAAMDVDTMKLASGDTALLTKLNAFVTANSVDGYIGWKVDRRINNGYPVFTTTEVPDDLVSAISRLDSESVQNAFPVRLNLNGISVCGITCEKTEDGKAFILKNSAGDALALDPVTHQLLPVANEKCAAKWYYNGGLYALVNVNRTCRGGFFRAPHYVKYYLAATAYGTAYARLLFAPALAEYETEVEAELPELKCTPGFTYVGLLKKCSYDFTITAPEGAKVCYAAGSFKGCGRTFTMLYRPAKVEITVTVPGATAQERPTATHWLATLTRTGYEMTIIG